MQPDLNGQIILVTGSAGLIGRALVPRLLRAGAEIIRCDAQDHMPAHREDICDEPSMRRLIEGATGVIHLAAVSRVIFGERHPDQCEKVNVNATQALLSTALEAARRPWFLYASSREVYGQQDHFPVAEDAPYRPMNTYARSKVGAERAVKTFQDLGLRAGILRFSSVYGDIFDHADRVVPAFALAALSGGELRVEGLGHIFDFTHVSDVAEGIYLAVKHIQKSRLPPTHFVSGVSTSLKELAQLAIEIGDAGAEITVAPQRSFDISKFQGDPAQAKARLGWEARMGLRDGLIELMCDFRLHKQRVDKIDPA